MNPFNKYDDQLYFHSREIKRTISDQIRKAVENPQLFDAARGTSFTMWRLCDAMRLPILEQIDYHRFNP